MRDKERARLPALRLAERAIVERRHDGLSRARGGDERLRVRPRFRSRARRFSISAW